MFILNVDIDLREGLEGSFVQTFKTIFVPAISRQEGFVRTELLRPKESGVPHRLVIEFEAQPLQQKWVATQLHQEVWPRMEDHFEGYSVQAYDAI